MYVRKCLILTEMGFFIYSNTPRDILLSNYLFLPQSVFKQTKNVKISRKLQRLHDFKRFFFIRSLLLFRLVFVNTHVFPQVVLVLASVGAHGAGEGVVRGVAQHVAVQAVLGRAGIATLHARKLLFTGMNQQVDLQVGLSVAFVAADVAREGLLAGVNLHVGPHDALADAGVATHVAGIGFVVAVVGPVYLEVLVGAEKVPAVRAREGLLSGVREEVVLQADALRVGVGALWTGKGLLTSVDPHMFLQLVFALEGLIALETDCHLRFRWRLWSAFLFWK